MAVMPASVAEVTNAGWSLALVLVRAYYSLVYFRTCSEVVVGVVAVGVIAI